MLAQRSELVVMQASGFTRMQVALAVMKTAIPLALHPLNVDKIMPVFRPQPLLGRQQWTAVHLLRTVLLGLGMLAQRSELVVMQASGFTRMQVALAVMKTATRSM
jgi:lipopolysaccharide export LptBFGC system permease protein LptF